MHLMSIELPWVLLSRLLQNLAW